MPIHTYVGGLEHAAQHMLYFRFVTRVLHEWGLVGSPEPVSRFVCNGMVLGADGRKMSKARGNGVLPDDVVAGHGADALRLAILADVPVDRDVAWEGERVVHKERFLRAFGAAVQAWLDEHPEPPGRLADAPDVDRARRIAREIEALDADLARVALQSGVARLHTLANLLRPWLTSPPPEPRARAAVTAAVRDVLTVFLPFAPEWATALLVRSGGVPARWPQPEVPAAEVVTVVLQVGGRKVAAVEVDAGADDATLRRAALEHDAVRARIGTADVRRVIVVAGRLVNVVL